MGEEQLKGELSRLGEEHREVTGQDVEVINWQEITGAKELVSVYEKETGLKVQRVDFDEIYGHISASVVI